MVAIAAALLPEVALAHAQLLLSDPAPGAVVRSVPPTVRLVFTEPVTPAGTGIKIYSPSGRQVAGTTIVRGSVLSAAVDADDAGTYVVVWQVYASDTHPSRGAFDFAVEHASANPFATLLDTPAAGTTTPLGLALQALARWLHFLGFALAFGVVAYGMLIRGADGSGRLVGAGVLLLVLAEPVSVVGQLASLSFDGDTALAVLGSSFGRLLGLRLGAALLAWTLIATARSWPMLAVGGAVAMLDGAGAHAIPSLPVVGQALVSVHVAGMGLWVGGLVAFLRSPDGRFARYALATFGVTAASGLLLALAHTSLGTALVTTDYGRLLILKILIVGGAVLAAALRRRRAELVIAALVVACAALLAALPPPV